MPTATMPSTRPAAPRAIAAGAPQASPSATTARAAEALDLAVEALFSKQHDDGHWCAELEGDSILNSEYLLMKVILGQHQAPQATDADLARFDKMCVYLRRLQREDGAWGQYPGSPMDLSATVKAYFALKIFGDNTDAPHMRRAREAILHNGGAENINTFSMFYLACLGQVSWDACPAIPPEIALLPRWFPFHLDKVAAWTRTMILPLALCTALRPVRRLPSTHGIGELFVDQARRDRLNKPWSSADPAGWTNIFLAIDRALKLAQKLGITPGRQAAIRAAERWLVSRMTPETTDGLGAIFPPMVYIQVAFQALGYGRDHPVIRTAEEQLDRFIVEQPDHVRIQPCFSPVWDTGIALYALTEAGRTSENDPRIDKACAWLRSCEVSRVGDWINNLRREDRHLRMGPGAEAGAWAFEYRNEWYPDVDDTAMVCKSLRRAGDTSPSRPNQSAALRGVRWILAMQNDDGGWAAFDRTRDRRWMEHVPFADHNAMQDPSCADITGRTIESLTTNGLAPEHPAIRRAVAYLRREQRPQGPWWGRWGCNFLYGSWQALGGLIAAGEDPASPYLLRAAQWLRDVQNPDGGFGESANSYLDESLMGKGPSTPSQTAWGLASLLYLVDPSDPAVERAVRYLCDTQLKQAMPADPPRHCLPEPRGGWREEWFTGTGFPKVFYLRYHLYRHYFPVMSLARYLRLSQDRARQAPASSRSG